MALFLIVLIVTVLLGFWFANAEQSALTSYLVTICGTFIAVFLSIQSGFYVEEVKLRNKYFALLEESIRAPMHDVMYLNLGRALTSAARNKSSENTNDSLDAFIDSLADQFVDSSARAITFKLSMDSATYSLNGAESMIRQLREQEEFPAFETLLNEVDKTPFTVKGTEAMEWLQVIQSSSELREAGTWEFRRQLPLLYSAIESEIFSVNSNPENGIALLSLVFAINEAIYKTTLEMAHINREITENDLFICLNSGFEFEEDTIETCISEAYSVLPGTFIRSG